MWVNVCFPRSLVCSATMASASWASTLSSGSSLTSGPFWLGECHFSQSCGFLLLLVTTSCSHTHCFKFWLYERAACGFSLLLLNLYVFHRRTHLISAQSEFIKCGLVRLVLMKQFRRCFDKVNSTESKKWNQTWSAFVFVWFPNAAILWDKTIVPAKLGTREKSDKRWYEKC